MLFIIPEKGEMKKAAITFLLEASSLVTNSLFSLSRERILKERR